MTNAFSPNYVSQIDTSDITRDRKISDMRKASIEARRQSSDPEVRKHALGTIPGISKKSDALIKSKAGAANISGWPKRGVLNQPPKNPKAVLDHGESSMKSAKLSRGRAI